MLRVGHARQSRQLIKHIFPMIILWITISLMSCNIDSSVGVNLLENQPLQIIYTDTLTPHMGTLVFDSISTGSSFNRLLVGHANDPDLGEISSTAFFQINLDSLGLIIDPIGNLIFDSLILDCNFDKYWFYDTVPDFTFSVYRVLGDIQQQSDGLLYNVDNYNYISPDSSYNKIGEATFKPRPNGENLEIRLSDEYGKGLVELLRQKGDPTDADFQRYYKGIALVPDSTDKCFLGFSTNTRLLLSYHIEYHPGVLESSRTIKFYAANNLMFNHIDYNRTGTGLTEAKTENFVVDSKYTHATTFIQGSSALGTVVTFPSLRDLTILSQRVIVTDAILDLYPKKDSYSLNSPLPSSLSVYDVDNLNRIGSQLTLRQSLNVDYEFKENTYYEFDITNFLQQQLYADPSSPHGLLFLLGGNEFNSSIDKLLFSDRTVGNKTKLQLKIATLGD